MEVVPLTPSTQVFWLGGIVSSVVCISIQIFLYALLPSSRKLDQMILTQLTIARMGNNIGNYVMMALNIKDLAVLCAHPTLGIHLLTDSAITIWMFLFTKNLYDKVIQVFTLKETNFVIVSVCVWLVTIPIGVVCPIFLSFDYNYCNIFYFTYVLLKCIVLMINFLLFCRIFWVIMTIKTDRDLKGLLRTCVISMMLLFVTSLQALVEIMLVDVTAYFLLIIKFSDLGHSFKVINSYQVIAITAIFIVRSRDVEQNSIQRTIAIRLKKIMA